MKRSISKFVQCYGVYFQTVFIRFQQFGRKEIQTTPNFNAVINNQIVVRNFATSNEQIINYFLTSTDFLYDTFLQFFSTW